jgi:DNA-binding MarR family transcriptional regulator
MMEQELNHPTDEILSVATSDSTETDEALKDEILSLLEQCGHQLHHRRGGKHGQKRILKILNANSSITQKELQEKLKIQAGSMSEIVTKLENNGFITKKRDEADKRKAILIITDKGREVYLANREKDLARDRQLFDCLSLEEKLQLREITKKLIEDWKDKLQFEDEHT